MALVKLAVQNVSCDSCGKVISRIVSKFNDARFESISTDGKTLSLECAQGDIEKIKQALKNYNYLDGGTKVSLAKIFAADVLSGSKGFLAENIFLSRITLVFGFLFVLTSIFQLFVLNAGGLEQLWPVLALVPFGIALNIASLWHVKLLNGNFLCSTGMMVGMIIGMMSGFMLGAIIGATNGMFAGSVAGMVVGMAIGGWAGKSVGVMGIMEGLMAGLMAGLMGPMLSVMMVADNLVPFLYLLFAACTVILAGMSYLIYREAGPIMDEKNVPATLNLLAIGVLALVLIVALAVLGPKAPLAWGTL